MLKNFTFHKMKSKSEINPEKATLHPLTKL